MITHEGVAPTAGHLGETIDAPDQHCCVGHHDHPGVHLYFSKLDIALLLIELVVALLVRSGLQRLGSTVPVNVHQYQDTTNGHGRNLEGDASHDKVVSSVDELFIRRTTGSRHTATYSLQANGTEIAADEDPWIETSFDQRVLGPAVQDKVLQCKVNSGGDKTWSEHQAANLEFHAWIAPWVTTHHKAANIAGSFSKCSKAQGKSICPCFGDDSNDDGSQKTSPEKRNEENVCASIRIVAIESQFHWAFFRDLETLFEISFRSRGGGLNDGK